MPQGGDLPGQVLGVGDGPLVLLAVLLEVTRSRSSCRFCASRISGAAYEAWSDSISVRKMNGYWSKRRSPGAKMFQTHPQR